MLLRKRHSNIIAIQVQGLQPLSGRKTVFSSFPKQPATEEFIARIPKVELHLHLEGTVEPELLVRLCAGREGLSRRELNDLYQFSDFEGFLEAYRRVTGMLTEPADFYHITANLCRRLAVQGIIYAETIFTPQIHTRHGLEHEKVIGFILQAIEEARIRGGPRVNLIYDTARQWGAQAAAECARLAASDRAVGRPVVGFGVGGDELSLPADELKEAFELAGGAGLKRYIHAGEVGGPESIWEALEVLGADRIGHGIAAAQDPVLLRKLAAGQVALDCCPTSNLMTRAVGSIEEHPLPVLMESGVPVTLGSDDPGFFGAWLQDEIALCARTWRWTEETVLGIMRSGLRYSFLEPADKQRLTQRLASRGETVD